MALNDSGVPKPLHVSGKRASSKPVHARTVLENMIFSGKIPSTTGKEVRSQSASQDSEVPTDSSNATKGGTPIKKPAAIQMMKMIQSFYQIQILIIVPVQRMILV